MGCVTRPEIPSYSPRPNSLPATFRPLAKSVAFSGGLTVSSLYRRGAFRKPRAKPMQKFSGVFMPMPTMRPTLLVVFMAVSSVTPVATLDADRLALGGLLFRDDTELAGSPGALSAIEVASGAGLTVAATLALSTSVAPSPGALTAIDGRADDRLVVSDAAVPFSVRASDHVVTDSGGEVTDALPLLPADDEDALAGAAGSSPVTSEVLVALFVAPLKTSRGMSPMAIAMPLISPRRDDVTAVIGSHGWSSVLYSLARKLSRVRRMSM